jgi:hypothetical protein
MVGLDEAVPLLLERAHLSPLLQPPGEQCGAKRRGDHPIRVRLNVVEEEELGHLEAKGKLNGLKLNFIGFFLNFIILA